MTKPAYLIEVEEAGINVSRYEARRFRAFLVHYQEFRAFVGRRLSGNDAREWMESLIVSSDGYNDEIKKGRSHEEIVTEQQEALRKILDLDGTGGQHRPEDLSKWMLNWVSEEGLTSSRMVLNSLVATKRQQRKPITCYAGTHARLMTSLEKHGFSSLDKLLNHLLDVDEGKAL